MLATAFTGELTKLRRTIAPWVTLGSLMTGPLFLALFMWIIRDPQRAAEFGLLGTKAALSGIEPTWSSFAGFLTLIVGLGGTLLLAFVAAYVFGREYSEGTAKIMLTLPIPRPWFVVAKLAVAAVWWLTIVLVVFVSGRSPSGPSRARSELPDRARSPNCGARAPAPWNAVRCRRCTGSRPGSACPPRSPRPVGLRRRWRKCPLTGGIRG